MTRFEKMILNSMPKWFYTEHSQRYTTVIRGYGFVLHRFGNQMYLSGLTIKYVDEARKCHQPKDPNNIVICEPQYAFVIPATNDFVAEVILNANPGILDA